MPEDTGLKLGKLLVIDDEIDFAQYLGSVAAMEGYQVRLTRSFDEFSAALEDFAPSTVIMDMVMPDTDGFEILRLLAAREYPAHIVIISGYAPLYLDCAVKMAEGLGLQSIRALQKPLKLKELRRVLADRQIPVASEDVVMS